MAGKTSIEWTDDTWNPFVGCSIVSPGCTNCYAMRMAARIEAMGKHPIAEHINVQTHYAGTTKRVNGNAVWTGKLALAPDHILTAPLRWKKARRIFVNSMGDLFHEDAPDEWIDKVFAVMALKPEHTFQVLTKRPERMQDWVSKYEGCVQDQAFILLRDRHGIDAAHAWNNHHGEVWPLPNVWLGTSCERQEEADERIPILLQTPAVVRFVSLEPLLAPIDLKRFLWGPWQDSRSQPVLRKSIQRRREPGLDWVIVGGESGHHARPMNPQWARDIRDQCEAAGVAFFFKQWGAHVHATQCDLQAEDSWTEVWIDENTVVACVGKKRAGRLLDGRQHDGFPEVRS